MAFLLTALGFLKRVPWQVYAAVAAILFAVVYINHREKAAVEAHKAAVEQKAAPAREKAADERLADTITILENKEQAHEAIDQANDVGPPSPAAVALACERLRKLGRIPPACRREGGNNP